MLEKVLRIYFAIILVPDASFHYKRKAKKYFFIARETRFILQCFAENFPII